MWRRGTDLADRVLNRPMLWEGASESFGNDGPISDNEVRIEADSVEAAIALVAALHGAAEDREWAIEEARGAHRRWTAPECTLRIGADHEGTHCASETAAGQETLWVRHPGGAWIESGIAARCTEAWYQRRWALARTNDGAIEVDAFRRRNPWNRRDALYTRRGELARATGLPLIEHGEEIEASAVAWPLEVEGHVERMQSRATTR